MSSSMRIKNNRFGVSPLEIIDLCMRFELKAKSKRKFHSFQKTINYRCTEPVLD